jgi:hypothetical protein
MAENHEDPPSGSSAAASAEQIKQDTAESAPAVSDVVENSFLSSMTFTSLQRDDICCNCDECDFTNTAAGGSSSNGGIIPATIRQALHRYKRRKLESGAPIRRTQCRTLVKRNLINNVAVWNWTMPRGAEPLVELGNSHRIIWVQRFPENSLIKAIGKGVLGSSHEEKDRTVMDWKQGGVYLIPANGGKAVGWIHQEATKESSSLQANKSESSSAIESSSGGPVVLLMVKIPIASLASAAGEHDDDEEDEHGDTKDAWTMLTLKICSAALKQSEKAASTPLLGQSFRVSKTDAVVLKEIMSSSPSS